MGRDAGAMKVTLALLGLGLGIVVVANKRPRTTTLRERAIEAQRVSAWAAQLARELAAEAT